VIPVALVTVTDDAPAAADPDSVVFTLSTVAVPVAIDPPAVSYTTNVGDASGRSARSTEIDPAVSS
jgi:hypothetical protein